MKKASQLIESRREFLNKKEKSTKVEELNKLMAEKLKEFGADSVIDLNEDQLNLFNEYVKTIKNELNKRETIPAKDVKGKVTEKDINDEKSFRKYAEDILKKAHGDDYDESIADEVISGIIDKTEDGDWGAAVGRIKASLGK